MSTQDTTPASTGGGATNEPITREYFMALTPESFEALPPTQRQAVIKWLTNHPHKLDKKASQSTKSSTDSSGKSPATTTTNATNTTNQPPISWDLISKLTSDEYEGFPRERQLEIQRWMDDPRNKRSK